MSSPSKRSLPKRELMYKVAFEQEAQKEFLKINTNDQKLIATKIIDLKNGNFTHDKSLIRVAHRKRY